METDGVTPGTGRGNIRYTDGYFQFGVVPDYRFSNFPDYRSAPKILVTWLQPAYSGNNPFGPFTIQWRDQDGV